MVKKKILAVDDNAVNLAAIEHTLQDEYEVIPMIAGKRAVKYLSCEKADLILLDVQMPGMNGVETLSEIRRLDNGMTVPVMFLTAANDAEASAEGFRLGILDYITKPFDGDDLKRRISRAFQKMNFMGTDCLSNEELRLRLIETAEAIPEENIVPTYKFEILRTRDNVRAGQCSLRIGHNSRLYYGGNIGYEIDPPFRGNHYAGKACLLLFDLARKHNLEYVIITCSPENIASRKTAEYAGGKLLEIAALPADNDMRANGATHKCIYKINL